MRYKITLSYNGAGFCGWQIQPGDPSVQGALQDALSTLLGTPTEVVGAGRTDTGVHASFYVAHFDYDAGAGTEAESGIEATATGGNRCPDLDTAQLAYHLNAILPKDIAIYSIEPVSDDFHARFSAKSREYQYFIHNRKNPFKNEFSWYCRFDLDIDRMNRACAYLLGTHDCKCFEKTGSDNRTSVCEIYAAGWEISERNVSGRSLVEPLATAGLSPSARAESIKMLSVNPLATPGLTEGEGPKLAWEGPIATQSGRGNEPAVKWSELKFTIEANRFLRNMVRAIVGTMVDIGRGKHEPEYILELLEKGTRSDAGQSVPGHALFLTGIKY